MPFRLGAPELIILLVIVILIFGVGRLGQIGKEVGTAIREFRKNVAPEDKDKAADKDQDQDSSKPAA